jgi:thiol-disulfide isomerase/thioredoxin
MKRVISVLVLSFALSAGALPGLGNGAAPPAVISGKLMGHDDKPMLKAHVHLARRDRPGPLASVEVSRDGTFRVAANESGLLFIQFTGVNHLMHEIPIYVAEPVEIKLNVSLKTYEYKDDLSGVKVIGDFNGFSPESATPMRKQPDGSYVAEFETTSGRFAYQLLGITKSGNSINGTQSEDYTYDGGGDYRSIITPENGRARVVFDPKNIVSAETTAQAHFIDASSKAAKFDSIYDEMLERRRSFSAAFAAYRRMGKPANEFNYDWSTYLSDLSKQIAAEKDPVLRQGLLISYLDLGYGVYGARLDSTTAREAIAEIPPTSTLWSIEPDLIGVALRNSGQEEKYAAYVEQVINNHPDPKARELVRMRYAPNRSIMSGKPVPAFSIASLDDPAITYTSESLKGKFYLIDFWATWCKPCIEEMDNMHRAYEKYRRRGFEILSLSFDDKPETVKRFRSGKWKMPWLNAIVGGGFDSEIVKRFEISGIPKPILVDRKGKIVAIENDLRGKNLDGTLSQILGGEK